MPVYKIIEITRFCIGILVVSLTIIFVYFKAAEIIDWNWFWVLSPITITVIIFILFVLMISIIVVRRNRKISSQVNNVKYIKK